MVQPCLSNPCPEPVPGVSAHLFLTLINTLVASKCQISNPDNYPFDYTPHLADGEEFDFVVVGAGSAGSAAANKLSENPDWKVLVLEAGTLPSTTSEIPSLLFSLEGTAEDWQYVTETSPKFCRGFKEQRCRWPRGKCLGGSSSINAMLYVRGNKRDFDHWAEQGNPGWDYNSVLKTYKEIEDLQVQELQSSNRYGRGGSIPLSQYNSNEPVEEAIMESARILGVPTVPEEQDLGYYRAVQTIDKGIRANAGKVFLGRAKQRPNLRVAVNTFVKRVVIEDGKATGVVVDLGSCIVTIKARKEVILSAGTINSPQILMLSGVGPKQHLTDLGISPVVDLPVGENLQDHMCFSGLYIALPGYVNNARPIDALYRYFMYQEGEAAQISITNMIGHVNTRNDSQYPNVQLFHIIFPQNDNYLIREFHRAINFTDELTELRTAVNTEAATFQFLPTLINPKSSGRILLTSNDPRDKPLIYPNYLEEEEDVETLLEGIKFALKQLETDAFKKFAPQLIDLQLKECDAFAYKSDNYWRCAIKYLANTLYHPVGTCKMAPREAQGVVDSRLKVHGIRSLRVIDASIMPNVTSGNTNAPSMMIGRKGATMVVEDWSRPQDEL